MKINKPNSWFIINAKPKQEFIAEKNLKLFGAKVYLPLFKKNVKKNKKKIKIIAPLFNGYLFAQFSIEDLYHKIKFAKGVKKILGSNNSVWAIDNDKIEDIKSRENDGIVVLKKKKERFKKGDHILIDEGDFDGWEGIFCEELPDCKRAMIMLTNVGFSSKLIVPKKYILLNNRN